MRYTPLALSGLVIVFVALAAPVSSAAQELPKTELFGGYSWTRDGDTDMNGWNAAITLNLRRWIGIAADVSGHYASLGTVDRAQYSVLAGPRVSVLRRGRFTPFAYALTGAFHTRSTFEFLAVSVTEGHTDPGMALGGGLGVRLSRRWSGEVKADAALVRSGGRTDSSPRVSAGLTLRLGELQP